MTRKSIVMLLAITSLSGLLFAGCSPAKPTVPAFFSVPATPDLTAHASTGYTPATQNPDMLAAGNLIKIECYDDEKLSGDYRINSDGKLLLPYEVEVTAAGLTLADLKTTLQQSFKAYFRTAPMFALQVTDKSVYVRALGLVNKPGPYLVTTTSSLDEVIGLAGGLEKNTTGQSTATYASIESPQGKTPIKLGEYFAGNKALVAGWNGGENIFFQSANEQGNNTELFNPNYVQVMGQVRTPGEYPFSESSNVFTYLVKAGGPTDRANTGRMLIVRLQGQQVQAFPISLDKLNEAPNMQGGDVLFVQADNATDLQKDASVFGSFASVVSSIATTVLVGASL